MMAPTVLTAFILVNFGTGSISALSCEECALASLTTSNAVITADISNFERNTRKDAGCGTWGTVYGTTVTCSAATVKFGKDLAAAATEGTDFVFRCATIDITLRYDFSYQGESGDDLEMHTEERGCVAVPPDNGYTTDNTCYDVASNVFLDSVMADVDIGISYATDQSLASQVAGDNVVCFCTSDNCNNVHTSDGEDVVIGELMMSTAPSMTDVGNGGFTTPAPNSGASAGLVNQRLITLILLGLVSVLAALK